VDTAASWPHSQWQCSQRRQAIIACDPNHSVCSRPVLHRVIPGQSLLCRVGGTSRLWGTPPAVYGPKALLQAEGPLVRRGGAVILTTARLAKLQVLWRSCARSEQQQ
jgi:hypothetical protein